MESWESWGRVRGKRLFKSLHELLCFLGLMLFIYNLLHGEFFPDLGFYRLPVPVVEILKGEIAGKFSDDPFGKGKFAFFRSRETTEFFKIPGRGYFIRVPDNCEDEAPP